MIVVECKRLIPPAYTGVNNKTSSSVKCINEAHADLLFIKAAQRLLDVNNWQRYSGKISSNFSLTDNKGNNMSEPAREGYNIRIDIPGFGNKTGKGYDWVKIEMIEYYENNESEMLLAMKVKPAKNPISHMGRTAHFFKSHASSTFILSRHELKISCTVIGRNEKANTSAKSLLEKIRNIFTALLAWLFFSKLQWKLLTKGILSYSNKEKELVK